MAESPAVMDILSSLKILIQRGGADILYTAERRDRGIQFEAAQVSRKLEDAVDPQARHGRTQQCNMVPLYIQRRLHPI